MPRLAGPLGLAIIQKVILNKMTLRMRYWLIAGCVRKQRYLWVQDLNNGAVTTAPVNTGTSFTLPPALALTPGHSFIWYVAAVSTNGAIVTWNAGQSFNLAALAAPTGLSANSSASTLQPTFSWAPVSDAGTYQLWIGDQTGAVVTLAKLTTASYALTASQALKTGHNYTWYVAVVSTNGVVLLWSSGVSISV